MNLVFIWLSAYFIKLLFCQEVKTAVSSFGYGMRKRINKLVKWDLKENSWRGNINVVQAIDDGAGEKLQDNEKPVIT